MENRSSEKRRGKMEILEDLNFYREKWFHANRIFQKNLEKCNELYNQAYHRIGGEARLDTSGLFDYVAECDKWLALYLETERELIEFLN